MRKALGACLLLAIVFAATWNGEAGEKPEPKPVTFRAGARVVVDATGRPIEVQASPELPEVIRTYIERRVAGWRFETPQQEGVAAGGVTYMLLGACAVPTQGGFRLGLDYKSNGPDMPNDWLRPPRYPPGAAMSGNEATIDVTYVVETDGRTTLEQMKFKGARPGMARDFEIAIRDWVKRLRFKPEELNGHPVRTRITTPVDFTLGDSAAGRRVHKKREDEAMKSPECKEANGYEYDSVVLDSPFKLQAEGVGRAL